MKGFDFDIAGTTLRCPDGRTGTVSHIDRIRRDPSLRFHALVAPLLIEPAGGGRIEGDLWIFDEALSDLPGETDKDKSNAIGTALAKFSQGHDLAPGFQVRAYVEDDEVVIHAGVR